MKRAIAAFFLILMIAGLCVFENLFTDGFCGQNVSKLKACRTLYTTDRRACAEECEKLRREWDKSTEKACFFINHYYIDEISGEMAALPVYALYDGGEFAATCDRINRLFEQIRHDQHISMDSFY